MVGNGLVDLNSLAKILQNIFDALHPESVDQEVHHQIRLVISKLQVQISFRRQKRRAEFAHGRQVFAQNHLPIFRIHRLAPGRVGLPLFVDRDAFAQPARHLVLRHLQRYDVTELMPENRLPIGRMSRLRGRTVGCDHWPEANAQVPGIPRHAEGAHTEIFLVWKNLHRRRLFEFNSILGANV